MTLAFDRTFEPRYGEAVEVAPGVRRITAPNPGPLTFRGTNTFLIGGAELAILDPGPADEAHLQAVLRAADSARILFILVSHSHLDHSAGARALQDRTGAPILAAAPRRTEPQADHLPAEAGVVPGFGPDRALLDGEILEIGKMRLEAIATPGHAADHLAFALPGRDIVFSGDHVMGWSTSIVAPPDGVMADYMASLEKLLARPETLYFPAHGGPLLDGHAFVRGLRAHRRMRERAVLDRLAAGDHTIPEIVRGVYRDLDPRLAAAAALSTLAHLQDLVGRGLAGVEGAARLDSTYWPTGPSPSGEVSGGGAGSSPGLAAGAGGTAGVDGSGVFGSG